MLFNPLAPPTVEMQTFLLPKSSCNSFMSFFHGLVQIVGFLSLVHRKGGFRYKTDVE